ncbi:uncharacterized protein N7477_004883 [Penicillium maclennaniae]|uniref:uncharacterized protein n=1 Tax=Penicillium maclennaniae TaxID=1343394 RepID=UPI0025409F46|nr:uncharacterized protein N7477_004883 [Penicillium maclennaniae]KAJ5674949.1 hypothetical protein N7477_004883 [Penicillium maclennaniae]
MTETLIVARNVFLLLIGLVVENPDEAVHSIIHLWYSALVRESNIDILHTRIRPLIQDICMKIKHKPSKILLANTLAHSRRDRRDRYMTCLPPSERIAFHKFRQNGLLLPFGFPRHDFTEPNPPVNRIIKGLKPMKGNADTLNGWSLEQASKQANEAAPADIYGKLFFLREILRSFLDRVSNFTIALRLLHLDASCLPDHLDNDSFSRMDISDQRLINPSPTCIPITCSILRIPGPRLFSRSRH